MDVSKYSWLVSDPESSEIFNEIFIRNVYSINQHDFKDRCVIDLGANVGIFSIFASVLGAKRVHAFEPSKKTFTKLNDNILKSNFNNISSFQVAVAERSGSRVTITDYNESGHNSIYGNFDAKNEVITLSLADILREITEHNIFLKIDCEGAEYDILKNITPADMEKVSTLAIEIHADLHPEIKGFDFVHDKLKECGFKQEKVEKTYWFAYTDKGAVAQHELPVTIERWTK